MTTPLTPTSTGSPCVTQLSRPSYSRRWKTGRPRERSWGLPVPPSLFIPRLDHSSSYGDGGSVVDHGRKPH